MFRYLILKYLEVEEAMAKSKAKNKAAIRKYDEDLPGLGNLYVKLDDWYDKTAVGKAEALREEKKRQYRKELRELLGG